MFHGLQSGIQLGRSAVLADSTGIMFGDQATHAPKGIPQLLIPSTQTVIVLQFESSPDVVAGTGVGYQLSRGAAVQGGDVGAASVHGSKHLSKLFALASLIAVHHSLPVFKRHKKKKKKKKLWLPTLRIARRTH